MENIVKTGIRWLLYILAFLIIAFAVLIILVRFATPILNHKKDFFVKWGEATFHLPVNIERVHASWHGFSPEISFENVNIGGEKADQLKLHIHQFSVGIDLWHSLLKMKLLPGLVEIDGAKIAIYQNSSQKAMFSNSFSQMDPVTWQELESISSWLLSQADISVSRVDVYWHSQNGEVLPLENVTLQIVNELWHHTISGHFQVQTPQKTQIKFIAKDLSAPFSFSNLSAKTYVKVMNADVVQWVRFIPYTFKDIEIKKGQLSGELWITWDQGKIKKVQNIVSIQEFNLDYLKNHHIQISHFMGNLAWEPENAGWKFEAKDLAISINQFLLRHGTIMGEVDFANQNRSARIQLEGVSLGFSQKWPEIRNLSGLLVWQNQKIILTQAKGFMLENPIEINSAEIDDFNKPVLLIHGVSKTNFENALPVLLHSPLSVKNEFNAFSLQGPMQLALKLSIPFTKTESPLAQGQIQFQNAALIFAKPWLNVTQLNGQFSFSNKTFSAANIQGLFLEQPILLSFNSSSKNPSDLQINVQGKVSVDVLKQKMTTAWLKNISGITDFTSNIVIQNFSQNLAVSANFKSDLKGITINGLPDPYGKQAQETKPLSFSTVFNGKSAFQLQGNYAEQLSWALKLNSTNFSLINGELHFGPGNANLQELPNLLITADIDYVNAKIWQNFFEAQNDQAQEESVLKMIREVDLNIKRLDAFGTIWNKVNLKLTSGERAIHLRVDAPAANGEMDIPLESDHIWWLNFQNLYWPDMKEEGKANLDPAKIPPINAKIQDLKYGKKSLGQIQLVTIKNVDGVKIEKLTSHLLDADLFLNGYWYKAGVQQHTMLKGYLNCRNLGNVLTVWNYPKTLEGGAGLIQFGFNWRDSPLNFSTKILNGQIKINLKHGAIIKVSEDTQAHLSLSRLINIFSITTLPRIFIDSHGLSGKGFPFSAMTGDFVFVNGKAQTQNFYMNGPIAQLWLRGQMDFADERYHLVLRVAPYVTGSLPIIAGVAGGPIVGGIAFIAEKIVGSSVGKAVGKSYKVEGSWQHPIITEIQRR